MGIVVLLTPIQFVFIYLYYFSHHIFILHLHNQHRMDHAPLHHSPLRPPGHWEQGKKQQKNLFNFSSQKTSNCAPDYLHHIPIHCPPALH